MSETKSGIFGSGVGLGTVLGIVFVILKLTDKIDWKWIWVLTPFWGGFALWGLMLLFMGLITLIILIIARVCG